jgi:hypothetical protein
MQGGTSRTSGGWTRLYASCIPTAKPSMQGEPPPPPPFPPPPFPLSPPPPSLPRSPLPPPAPLAHHFSCSNPPYAVGCIARPPWDDPDRIRKVIKGGDDLFERSTETLNHIKGCMHAPRSVSEADDHPYCRYENF